MVKSFGAIKENFVRVGQTEEGYFYSYDRNKYNTMGLILNPKLEFPLLSFVGLQISPKVILNKKKSLYGVGFGFILGKLR